jgi:hypothetical protein
MKSTLVLISLAAVMPALGATFNVDDTRDYHDSAPGNGVCQAANNKCTLRAAIEEANSSVALDTVIVPTGVYRLRFGALKITTDTKKRDQMLHDALKRTRDEAFYVPLHHQLRPWAMKKGVTPNYDVLDRHHARFTTVK